MKRQILLRRADLARHLGVSKETLWNWTKTGLLIPAASTIGGNRYDPEECEKRFKKIQRLKQQRKTLGEIKDILDKGAFPSPPPKPPKLKPKSIPIAKKAGSETSKRDAVKPELPEFQSLQSEKLQIPMDYELIASLGRIEKWIMAHREKGQQRITKNSIVRACLKVLLPVLYADPGKLIDISTEQELVDKISGLLKIKRGSKSRNL